MATENTHGSKALLKHRRVTGREFWESKIHDSEDLKTRQAEYTQSVSTNSKVIFYESMSGARMMDSPYALFLRLYDDPSYLGFQHVWSVRSSDLIPEEFKDDPRVTFVKRGTDSHLYFLALARFIIGNSLLPEHFVRKADQKYLNTWHGIAYKALGRTDASPLGAAGSVYNMLQATHILTPCPYMTEIELTRFSLRGVFAGKMAEVGYPRQDATINMTEEKAHRLKERLSLDPNKKTVLYAPTWRGNKGSARFDAGQLERDLERLAQLDTNVVFQAHHIMLRHIKHVDYGNIVVPPANIVTNELLAVVDLLISDYSSIFFDFLATGKPVVHYLYDYDEYDEERGLFLAQDELPGPIVLTGDKLVSTVNDLVSAPYEPTPEYQRARARFCPHDDGQACHRTVQWFFKDESSNVKQIEARSQRTVVFWGGRLDKSRKTEVFLDAVNDAARTGNQHVTLFVAHSVKSNEVAMNRIKRLDPSVSVVARNDFEMIMTVAERKARNGDSDSPEREQQKGKFLEWGRFKNMLAKKTPKVKSDRELLSNMYQREYRRVFGDTQFDEVVKLDGLSGFWRQLAKYASERS